MTLDELSEGWNDLRNSVFGRGQKATVPPQLAARVASEYGRWRQYRQDATPFTDMLTQWSTRRWITRYRRLLEATLRAGAPQPKTVLEVTEIEFAAKTADRMATNVAIGAGFGALGLLALILSRRGRRSNGF